MFQRKSKEKKMAEEADAKLQAILARRESRKHGGESVSEVPSSATTSPPPEKEDDKKPEGSAFLKNIKRIVSLGKAGREDTPTRSVEPGAIMIQGGGALACCPLKSETYQKAFELQDDGQRSRSSRLYTTFTGVLGDQAPLEAFVHFLTQQKQLDLLRFWLAAEKFRAESASMKPEDRAERALTVYRTYVCRNGSSDIGLDDDVVRAVELSLSPEDGVVSSECLTPAGEAVLARMEEVYLPLFLQSSSYVNYSMRVLAPDNVTVEDFIYNEAAMMPFMEFLERENAVVLLHFWLAADNFEQQVEAGLPATEIQADAMGIYKRFFHPQASESLGVDESTRMHIENKISAGDGVVQVDAFERARHLVITALRLHFLPLFLKSDLYNQFMNDVMKSASAIHMSSRPDSPPTTPNAQDAPVERGDQRAVVTPWGEYIADTQFAKFTLPDHGDLASKLNDFMKLTVGRMRVRKADLDLAMQVSRQIVEELYHEMDAHGTRGTALLLPSAVGKVEPSDYPPFGFSVAADWDGRMSDAAAVMADPAWDRADAI